MANLQRAHRPRLYPQEAAWRLIISIKASVDVKTAVLSRQNSYSQINLTEMPCSLEPGVATTGPWKLKLQCFVFFLAVSWKRMNCMQVRSILTRGG
jgi:hypothetical protein